MRAAGATLAASGDLEHEALYLGIGWVHMNLYVCPAHAAGETLAASGDLEHEALYIAQ